MIKNEKKAELFARGRGICHGAIFARDVLGRTHEFLFSECQVRVRLPTAEFETGNNQPVGKSAEAVHFRMGWVNDPNPNRTFYGLEFITVEVDFKEPVRIPLAVLANEHVQKSPELTKQAPHLDKLADHYDQLLNSAWRQWMRVARWATNQHSIGLSHWSSAENKDMQMSRIHEKETGCGVWALPIIIQARRSATIDLKRWEHIRDVLVAGQTPPVWFEYLVEANQRINSQDFSGCVLSSVIACETLARAVYRHLAGTPTNPAAAELVDRTAAQAIIGRWKDLTGIKAEGKVHRIFEIRNGLVHSGRTDFVDEKIANEALQTARKFVESGDEWWFAEQGLPNPRTAVLE